jgi:hypothetical protein
LPLIFSLTENTAPFHGHWRKLSGCSCLKSS